MSPKLRVPYLHGHTGVQISNVVRPWSTMVQGVVGQHYKYWESCVRCIFPVDDGLPGLVLSESILIIFTIPEHCRCISTFILPRSNHEQESNCLPLCLPLPLQRRPPWQTGRMALSRRACRFEIPMDVFVLENMSPTEYLQQYCIVSKRRQAMYRRSFSKVDKDNDMKINMKVIWS